MNLIYRELLGNKKMKIYRLIAVLMLCVCSDKLFAGSTAKAEAQFAPEQITGFAKQVEKYAAAQGARVFIIARVGRPPEELPKGVTFTHTAIAIYSSITLPDGKTAQGYAIHNLYQNDKKLDRSDLVIDYPVDFFWGAHQLRAGIIIPSPDLQQRLLQAYANGVDKAMHRPAYSILANPFNDRYQNCTEYTLDVINAAIYQTTDYQQIKANTKAHFKAHPIKVSGLKLLVGSMLMEDVKIQDHSSKVVTATFDTIGDYLADNRLLERAVIFEQDGRLTSI